MGDSGYKGISASQDSRFKNKDQALLKSMKFAAHFDRKVDMKKVELDVIKPWIATRVTELLGFEDDVVLEYASGMLEEERYPDPRKVQIQLTGFLEAQTAVFMQELWTLLLSAQDSPGGIPAIFVQQKKEELRLKREKDEQTLREARQRSQLAATDSRGNASSRQGGDTRDAQGSRNQNGRRHDRSGPPSNSSFKDRNGNTTNRVRDSGWGSHAGSRFRDDRDSRRDHDRAATRFEQGDSRRSRSLSRSPRPTATRSQHGEDRMETKRRERSRSRSVTPDYRAEKRSRRPNPEDRHPRRSRRTSSPRRYSTESEGDITPKMGKSTRSSYKSRDDDDHDRNRRRRTPPSQSRWDNEKGEQSKLSVQEERNREAELRAKLLRAKNSQS